MKKPYARPAVRRGLLSATAERMLRRKVSRFKREAARNWNWMKKNHHRCGHDTTSDALGDEGWMESHRRGGIASAFDDAAAQLERILKKLTKGKS